MELHEEADRWHGHHRRAPEAGRQGLAHDQARGVLGRVLRLRVGVRGGVDVDVRQRQAGGGGAEGGAEQGGDQADLDEKDICDDPQGDTATYTEPEYSVCDSMTARCDIFCMHLLQNAPRNSADMT